MSRVDVQVGEEKSLRGNQSVAWRWAMHLSAAFLLKSSEGPLRMGWIAAKKTCCSRVWLLEEAVVLFTSGHQMYGD